VAAGRQVLLVDLALFNGKPATIIMVGQPSGQAIVYAAGPLCSAKTKDIQAQQVMSSP